MENLTTPAFKLKIFDYTISQQWSYKGDKPAIIDFYADWCNPCKMVTPILEELSKEYSEIDFYKVNTDEENEIAATFGIRSIPMILLIPMTGQPQMIVGAHPKQKFVTAIENVFNIKH